MSTQEELEDEEHGWLVRICAVQEVRVCLEVNMTQDFMCVSEEGE